jgi:hypothetical protein
MNESGLMLPDNATFGQNGLISSNVHALEESLSVTTGRCDLAIATHARKMHKNLFVVVHPEVLDND